MRINPYAVSDPSLAGKSNGRSFIGNLLYGMFIAVVVATFVGVGLALAIQFDPNLRLSFIWLILAISLASWLFFVVQNRTTWLQTARVWIARDAYAFTERGLVLLSRGQIDEAMSDFDQAISRDSAFPYGFNGRAVAWLRRRRWDRALEDASQAIELDPTFAQAYNTRSVAWLEKADYQNTIEDCSQAIRLAPKLGSAFINRSGALLVLERPVEALHDTTRAWELGERGLSIRDLHGKALLANGHFKKAYKVTSGALKKFGKHKELYLLRGQIAACLLRYESAVKDHEQAVALDADYGQAWNGLVAAYLRVNRYDDAIQASSRAIQLGADDATLHSGRGLAFHYSGRLHEAIESHELALQANGSDPVVRNNRGYTLHALGRFEEAAADYEKAMELHPDLPNPYKNLAWQLATCPVDDLRDAGRAVALATKAHELTDWQQQDWLPILAAAYAEAGDFDSAIQWQQKAEPDASRLGLYEAGRPFRE